MKTYRVRVFVQNGQIIYPPELNIRAEEIISVNYDLENSTVFIKTYADLPLSDEIVLMKEE